MPDSPTQRNDLSEADPFANNVDLIARLEKQALHERSVGEKVSDEITRFTGNIVFVMFHLVLFGVWAVWNTGLVPGLQPFDPFPFGILTLIVSGEGVFLALFILISQNRMSRHADRRAHLGLQVSMLAEQELTTLLHMQKQVNEHLGIEPDASRPEADRLMKPTDVESLIEELDENLPE
jgi:uncharacterized membrane protein